MVSEQYYRYTRAQAFKKLFGKKISAYGNLKDKLTTFERNGVLPYASEAGVQRDKRLFHDANLPLFYNLVLLLAFFPKPSHVTKLVLNFEERARVASVLSLILKERKSSIPEVMFSEDLESFIEAISSWGDITEKQFPNPFIELPTAFFDGREVSLPEVILTANTKQTGQDEMLLAFLQHDFKRAYRIAAATTFEALDARLLSEYIMKTYKNAQEFKNYLDEVF
ncbi:hypothetical protein [Halodesulfovibrio sp.]|jgi:hypothetical protein|uniref:hypothetical protein n=1 Tax=Halodesulfovibrio sp. TaxID=1912772 RepID=UPI0025E87198|nr:hypothetical protein [Halodesulfovibrio sp.]MCT4625470.1 hypothetical protein [Halodesulfovibrio sp.]